MLSFRNFVLSFKNIFILARSIVCVVVIHLNFLLRWSHWGNYLRTWRSSIDTDWSFSVLRFLVNVLFACNFLRSIWNSFGMRMSISRSISGLIGLLILFWACLFYCNIFVLSLFWLFIDLLSRLMIMNVILHILKDIFINIDGVSVVVEVVLLTFADPILFWDHVEVSFFRVSKALVFLEIGLFQSMSVPLKKLKHGRVFSSSLGGFSEYFLREMYFGGNNILLLLFCKCSHDFLNSKLKL